MKLSGFGRTSHEVVGTVASPALDVARAGSHAADAFPLVVSALRSESFPRFDRDGRLVLVSVGKAAPAMHAAMVSHFKDRVSASLVVALERRAQIDGATFVGSHPLPSAQSEHAAAAIRDLLQRTALTEADTVVFAISGGTSAMISAPVPPLDIQDVRRLTRQLLRSGLDGTSVNWVRGCVSSVHGGGLLAMTRPARGVGLILTDNLQLGAQGVGSAPLSSQPLRSDLAATIVRRFLRPARFRDKVLEAIENRARAWHPLEPIPLIEVGNPATALRGAEREARRLGYRVVTLTDTLQGEAGQVAKALGSIYRYQVGRADARPLCVLAAGEVTTVAVAGGHNGGRCQELAWAMMPEIQGTPGSSFAALATDGRDFMAGVGGAVVREHSLAVVAELGFEWDKLLRRHSTYPGLRAIGALVEGWDSNTNVCDLYVFCRT